MDPFGLLISLVAWEGTFRVSAEGTLAEPAEVARAAADVDNATSCYLRGVRTDTRTDGENRTSASTASAAEPAAATVRGRAR